MKRTSLLILTLCLLAVLLTACGECEHQWEAATCDKPISCAKCGQTQGTAAGHSWMDATCDAPKTCSVCKITEGAALGHSWMDATCDAPKTCSVCKITEGEALGHSWVDATCDAPKTCTVCQATEGAALSHDWEAATCQAPKTCKLCGKTEGEKSEHKWLPATVNAPKTCEICGIREGDKLPDARFDPVLAAPLFGHWVCEYVVDGEAATGMVIPGVDLDYIAYMGFDFRADGTYTLTMSYDEESYKRATTAYTIELMYRTFEEKGLNREQSDAAMLQAYGKDVTQYVIDEVNAINVDEMKTFTEGVYYLQNGKFYDGSGWNEKMEIFDYTLENGVLTLTDESGSTVLVFKKSV